MLLHPGCGPLGVVSLPYAVLSLLVPLLFLPLSVIAADTCLAAGTICDICRDRSSHHLRYLRHRHRDRPGETGGS